MTATIERIKVGNITIRPTTDHPASSYGIPVWPGMEPLRAGQVVTLKLAQLPNPLNTSLRCPVIWADDCWAILMLPDLGEGQMPVALQYITGRVHYIYDANYSPAVLRQMADKGELMIEETIPDWTGETLALTII